MNRIAVSKIKITTSTTGNREGKDLKPSSATETTLLYRTPGIRPNSLIPETAFHQALLL